MGLTAEKKRLIIRRVIFAVLLIFCAVIQNTPGLLPEPFGAHQLAVTVMVVCIAMFERETAGMLLGLLAGVVLDVTGGTQGINAILLTVVGLVCGMLVNICASVGRISSLPLNKIPCSAKYRVMSP